MPRAGTSMTEAHSQENMGRSGEQVIDGDHHLSKPSSGGDLDFDLDWSFLDRGDLFGRDQELKALQTAVSRTLLCQPESPSSSPSTSSRSSTRIKPEFLLLSGHSGCGKTVLVKSLRKFVVDAHNGFVFIGKFDQLQQAAAEPFGPFVAAHHSTRKHVGTTSRTRTAG